jgi:hypothetical protein
MTSDSGPQRGLEQIERLPEALVAALAGPRAYPLGRDASNPGDSE